MEGKRHSRRHFENPLATLPSADVFVGALLPPLPSSPLSSGIPLTDALLWNLVAAAVTGSGIPHLLASGKQEGKGRKQEEEREDGLPW